MEEGKSMFWGVILKPDKRYEQVVEDAFHVSKACVEPSSSEGGKITSVYLEKESDEFIICNLKGNNVLSENLDLNFNAGEKICFRAEGGATVHLTGYLVDEDPMGYDDSMMGGMMGDSEDEELEEEEEDEEEETPKLVKKRKLEANGDSPANSKKKKGEPTALDKLLSESKKSKDKDVKQAQAMKKILEAGKKPSGDADEDDSDEDDDDYEMEESGDEEDDSGEEEEDEDDDEDGEEEEEEEEEESPKSTPQKTPQNKKDKKQKVLGGQNGTPMPKDTPKNGVKEKDKQKETPKSNKKKDKKDQENKQVNGQSPTKTPGKTPKRTLKGGLQVEDLKVGNGPEAVPGKHVGMYYKGQLKNGKVFDSCLSGKPFKFKLGKGEVIKGWEVGVNGMKVGGKRRLIVPAPMAYGSQGAPPDIPPNATLSFEVECKMVN